MPLVTATYHCDNSQSGKNQGKLISCQNDLILAKEKISKKTAVTKASVLISTRVSRKLTPKCQLLKYLKDTKYLNHTAKEKKLIKKKNTPA